MSRTRPKSKRGRGKVSRDAFRRRVARAQRKHGQYVIVRTGRPHGARGEQEQA